MSRILLLLPTGTYRAADFLLAATRLGVDVVVGSEHPQALSEFMGDRALVVPLAAGDAGMEAIVALHRRTPLDAVLAVDDQGLEVAAAAAVPQPLYRIVVPDADVAAAATENGYPCVVKPVSRSGSQGVIRVDNAIEAVAAGARIRAILGDSPEPLLVESFVPGAEVAVLACS